MTSLQGLLPPPGCSNWRKSRVYNHDEEDSIVVRHVVIREVWVEKRPWPHAVYKVDVLSQTSHWFVFKRYKEFYQLHLKLVKLHGVPKNLLPPRKLTNNMARENLESRREALEHYLQKLLNSCNGSVRQSEELADFLDVKSHDVAHVTFNLATYLQKNGPSILMSKEMFHMSPSQLYCVTKQLQLPHPSGRNAVDLGVLYEFVAELKKLSITDFISQASNGEQHEITFTFDLGMFTSLKHLQVDAINIESIQGMEHLCPKLRKITARYCLASMKSLLIDAALEKRSAPQVNLSAESWRVNAAYRLADKRVIFQQWHSLTHINFSHNNITTFDTSMSLLPVLRQLDLSHNKINHLDLQLVTSPNLKTLSLASNDVYLISATDKPIDNLKNLNLSHNKIQNIEGLLCCQGLEDLNISYNKLALVGEVKVLASLSYLKKLAVDGNHFAKKKRHRIIIFAYFRDRELLLGKKLATRKEKAKIDAKLAALENFQDIDDSLSSISTVSDDSVTDSGIDHSNWISNLASLSEVEENEHDPVPQIYWDELHGASGGSETSSTASGSGTDEQRQQHKQTFSREDWDRLIQADTKKLVIPSRVKHDDAGAISERTLCPNSKHGTLKNENNSKNDNSNYKQRLDVRREDTTVKREDVAVAGPSRVIPPAGAGPSRLESVPEVPSPRKKTSWVSNFFRRPGVGEKIEEKESSSDSQVECVDGILEYKVNETEVSRSFDDNCDFERAQECDEAGAESSGSTTSDEES